MKLIYISSVLFCFSLLFLGVTIGVYISNMNDQGEIGFSKKDAPGIIEDVSSCQNLSIENTSNCLRDYVSTFFIYNKTDDALVLSFESLKKRGGDCLNWARLYKNMAEELGFNGKVHILRIDNTRDHAFATISNSEGYCKLDQVSEPDCFYFKQ